MKQFFLFLCVVLVWESVLTACSGQVEPSPTVTPKLTDTHQPSATPTLAPTSTPKPADMLIPTDTPIPTMLLSTVISTSVPLSRRGPWGVIQAEDGIWAINVDGTGLRRLTEDKRFAEIAISPFGGQVAYVVATSAENQYPPDLALRLISLPEETVQTLTDLQIPKDLKMPPSQDIPSDWSFAARQVAQALSMGSLDWSPDGQRLAFVSGHDGPAANVYVYSLETKKIVRLTNRPHHAYQVRWSPNSKYIFFAEVRDFGVGAGVSEGSAWVVQADRPESQPVWGINPPSPDWEEESLISWLSPDTLIMRSYAQPCGEIKLRTVNISTGETHMLWPDCFTSLARDPVSGTILLSKGESNGFNSSSSLFLISPDGSPKTIVSSDHFYYSQTKWVADLQSFLFLGEDLFTASLSGEVAAVPVSLPEPTLPIESPDGGLWAWASSQGLWIGIWGQQPEQVFTHPVEFVSWSPDRKALFFYSEGAFYVARSSSFAPEVLSTTLKPIQQTTVSWVLP